MIVKTDPGPGETCAEACSDLEKFATDDNPSFLAEVINLELDQNVHNFRQTDVDGLLELRKEAQHARDTTEIDYLDACFAYGGRALLDHSIMPDVPPQRLAS